MILTALQISLCILAVYACTREGMIFYRARAVIHSAADRIFGVKRSEWVCKPLFECLICMSSVWGTAFSVAVGIPITELPVVVLLVCGFNTLFSALTIHLFLRYDE